MTDLKKGSQRGVGAAAGVGAPEGSEDQPRRPSTAGEDDDLDRSGVSKNQGHGHPREERDPRTP